MLIEGEHATIITPDTHVSSITRVETGNFCLGSILMKAHFDTDTSEYVLNLLL